MLRIKPLLAVPLVAALFVGVSAGAAPAPARQTTTTTKAPTKPTAAEAKAFIATVNADIKRLGTQAARAEWVKNTYITDDTEILSAEAGEVLMIYLAGAIKQTSTT